jgi:uncharacterized membrane protein
MHAAAGSGSARGAGAALRRRPLSTAIDRFGAGPHWLRGLIALQVVVILGAAVVMATRAFPLVGPDEAANASYVQIVAEQHRLPLEDHDCLSNALLEAGARPPGCLYGSSYEAFQPPLYYVLAAPVWLLAPGGVHGALRAVRLLDVLLLAAALVGVWWLCRELFGQRRGYGLGLALCAFLLPALIVEQTFIGNDALELALVPFVLTACLRAARGPQSRRRLVLAAVLVGAVLLTKLTSLYVLVPYAAAVLVRLRAGNRRTAFGALAIAALIPLVILAPWLADNLHHYHALTANQIAHDYQAPILNPTHVHYAWNQVLSLDRSVLANDQAKLCGRSGALSPLPRDALFYVVLALVVLGPVVLRWRGDGMAGLVTLLPVALAVLLYDAIHVLAQQEVDIPRFLHPTLAPFLAGVALLIDPRPGWRRRGVVAGAVALTAVAIVYWVRLAAHPGALCL